MVVKESENFFGVHEIIAYHPETPITSGTSLSNASKKAKLLQMGYNIHKDYSSDYYY